MNFSNVPVFDNHTHTLDPRSIQLTPLELALNFLHGYRDVLPKTPGGPNGISEELQLHIENMGVVHTMVNHLSKLFACEPTLQAVTEERNRRTTEGMVDYTKLLYKDAGIMGTVVESVLPMNDPIVGLFPCRIFRLFKLDNRLFELFNQYDSYLEFKQALQGKIEYAVKTEGYIGIKCHIAEVYTLDARPVYDKEAIQAYAAAKAKDREAMLTVYFAIFTATMLQCQELDIPLHIHTGVTGQSAITGQPAFSGEIKQGHVHDTDPFLLSNFLTEPQLLNTKLVLLHAAYPWIRNAAMMAHNFPHVWVDVSWTLPWTSIGFNPIIEEILAIAPHSKIMTGSGQHGIPEIAWLTAKVMKASLHAVLTKAVECDYLAEQQAQKTGEMVLYRNAQRLYKF
ncbi:amidohydrolase family protein [Paenibacillus thalictri]|nr:amidohydrolase family protein [Paenibacillus thalictri]